VVHAVAAYERAFKYLEAALAEMAVHGSSAAIRRSPISI
jgi:hypothetical protein